MKPESIVLTLLFLILGGVFSLVQMIARQRTDLRRLEIKMDALIKAQGIECSPLSPEVQSLVGSSRKIAAIKLYRDENPGISIAEAKADVEAFAANKRHSF